MKRGGQTWLRTKPRISKRRAQSVTVKRETMIINRLIESNLNVGKMEPEGNA
jgi:hypothetical protein